MEKKSFKENSDLNDRLKLEIARLSPEVDQLSKDCRLHCDMNLRMETMMGDFIEVNCNGIYLLKINTFYAHLKVLA